MFPNSQMVSALQTQECVPSDMRAVITSSRGHLFKDNKPGLSMLGFYGMVPALKAMTGANPAPTVTRSPPFGQLFLSVNLSRGKSTEPLHPHHWHPCTSPPPGPQEMRSSLWELVGQPQIPAAGETQKVNRKFSWTKEKIYSSLNLESCSAGDKTTQPCLLSATSDRSGLGCCLQQASDLWII